MIFDKEMQHWQWNKTWNIPIITVQLSLKENKKMPVKMPQGLYTKIFAVRLKDKDEPVPKGSMLLEKSLKTRQNKKIITQIMRKKSSGVLSGERLVLDEPG